MVILKTINNKKRQYVYIIRLVENMLKSEDTDYVLLYLYSKHRTEVVFKGNKYHNLTILYFSSHNKRGKQ